MGSLRVLGALLAALAASGGCGAFDSFHEYSISQAALVPAPSGPSGVGPLPGRERFSVEGSYSTTWVRTSARTRLEGASGNVVADRVYSGRLAVGLGDRAEIGFGVTERSSRRARAVARDVEVGILDGRHSTFFDTGARVLFSGTRAAGFGVVGEWSFGEVPYRRDIVEDVVFVSHPSRSFVRPSGAAPPADRVSSWTEPTETRIDTEVSSHVKLGLFGTRQFAAVHLSGGALVQWVPHAFGNMSTFAHCHAAEGQPATCGGVGPDEVEPLDSRQALTFFAALAWDVEPFTLLASAHWNLLGDAEIVGPSPLGAQLAARVTFLP